MSAFLCSQDLINLIVNASDKPSARLFRALVNENLASLRFRYGDAAISKHDEKDAKQYKYEKITPRELIARVYSESQGSAKYYPAVKMNLTDDLIAAQIRKACVCFDYQSCEHPEWNDSKVCFIVEQTMMKYPGNDKLEDACLWGF